MPSAEAPAPKSAGEAHAPQPCEVTIVAHDVGSVGGMERVLGELALGLDSSGHEVTVIARKCVLPPGSGVRFRRVRGPGRPLLLAHPWFMLAGSLAMRRWRRGVVQATGAIVLGHVDVISVHYCHQVGPVNPSSGSLPYRLHAVAAGWLKRSTERLCYRPAGASRFVCVSEGVADEMRAHFPAIAERVVTIHNGVDTTAFAPGARAADARALRARLGVGPEAMLAAFVGSEWQRKGLEQAIRAIALAPGWELLVAGGGDLERYQGLADSLGVASAVHWLGVTPDVQPVYQAANAFVLPTSYETFSLVSFEAAASGLPVLATPVNGVRELLRDGENGYLIDRYPDQIALRLRELGADPELRASIGAAARASALDFSWQRMVAEHDALYRSLLPRSASAPAGRSRPAP